MGFFKNASVFRVQKFYPWISALLSIFTVYLYSFYCNWVTSKRIPDSGIIIKYTAEVAKADKVSRSGRKNAMNYYDDIPAIFYLQFLKKKNATKDIFFPVILASASSWNIT